jgi:tellurite methyltransferase
MVQGANQAMSAEDRAKWNTKYADRNFAPRNPSPVLLELADYLPSQGRALDIAGGAGRHSLWLAQRGLDVTLADISPVGLKLANERAATANLKLTTLEVDLAEQGPPPGPWDIIVSICYLWKPMPKLIASLLAPRGVFIMIQPTTVNLTRHEKPPRDFLLMPGELGAAFEREDCALGSLELVEYSEGWRADDLHDAVLVVRHL